MSRYLMKFKNDYRLLADMDEKSHDIPRDNSGDINESFEDIYISCRNNNRIYTYGHEPGNKKLVWLTAYIPSIGRGHNIMKIIKEKGIEYKNYEETDSEILFRFKAKDISVVADLLKAKTAGKGISPFSSKNLPKSDLFIPESLLLKYKDAIKNIVNPLAIKTINNDFLKIIEKKEQKKNKKFDIKKDMKSKCMGRQTKEYIYSMGYMDEYIAAITKYNKTEDKNMYTRGTEYEV